MRMFSFASLLALLFAGPLPTFAQQDTTVSFDVRGTCIQCKQRIEKAARAAGATTATWDLRTKLLTVRLDPDRVSIDKLQEIISWTGHDTEKYKARERDYKALPECCLYREITELSNYETLDPGEQEEHIYGLVVEDRNGEPHPLAGATITTLDNRKAAISNLHGEFILSAGEEISQLVVSYAGFRTDTISLDGLKDIQITLSRRDNGQGIVVTARTRPAYTLTRGAFRTSIITKLELLKAACCNLSESFETTPAVDVVTNDALTGSKQIQLLGLSGIYTQLTVENMPGPRGIATAMGLNSIAGPWIESIQIIKGTGSVVNGFESMAGQINVELRKPTTSEKLYLNGYVNSIGKTDLNANLAFKLNGRWSTMFLLHNDFLFHKVDFDEDGFRDLPTGNLFSAVNRWEYRGTEGLFAQFGFKILADKRTGGETDFRESTDKLSTHHYGIGINTGRYEFFSKTGYIFPNNSKKSIGLQLSGFSHNLDSYFGVRQYNAGQQNIYANLIFQTPLGNGKHLLKTGLSMIYDNFQELAIGKRWDRTEKIGGAFGEYAFHPNEKIELIAGIRTDHRNLSGWFLTPRLNLRYAPVPTTTFRFNAGRGQRTANIFAENMAYWASSREIRVLNVGGDAAYGLAPEVSWNFGAALDQKFTLFNKTFTVGLDFYLNDFTNQVIVDLETPGYVDFYNLSGKSFSNSFQAELNVSPAKGFDVRLAYRYFDIKSSYDKMLLSKPLTARHRAFINLAYEVDGWAFDYTINYTGSKRIPMVAEEFQFPASSPSFITMSAQLSKKLGEKKAFELYAGAENLGNYFQEPLILSHEQPFGKHFDASMIWGPASNRLFYGGFRYTLK